MDVNIVSLLCLALILASHTNQVNGGDSEVVSNSNLTVGGGGTEVVTNVTDSKSIDHSSNMTDVTISTDGSKKKGSVDIDSTSKSQGSDEGESGTKEEVEEEEAVSVTSRKKEGFHGEECDPSNMCTDEQHQFVACLRVPGNDAPHLSLLIQNKAKSALLVTITAPGFVRLEKNKVQLLENENTKVKVSIRKGGSNDSAIIITSSKGHCSLELKDLAATDEAGNDGTSTVSRPSIFNIRPRTLIVIVMISFLVLSLVIIPVLIHVCRNKSQGNNKYQRLDMELPVSSPAAVSKSDQDDGWNNNWGDDWDDENGNDGDEEQPVTSPVLPVTPSVSSRGLAPRRLSKEGWKD